MTWEQELSAHGWHVAQGRDGRYYAVHRTGEMEQPLKAQDYEAAVSEVYNEVAPDVDASEVDYER